MEREKFDNIKAVILSAAKSCESRGVFNKVSIKDISAKVEIVAPDKQGHSFITVSTSEGRYDKNMKRLVSKLNAEPYSLEISDRQLFTLKEERAANKATFFLNSTQLQKLYSSIVQTVEEERAQVSGPRSLEVTNATGSADLMKNFKSSSELASNSEEAKIADNPKDGKLGKMQGESADLMKNLKLPSKLASNSEEAKIAGSAKGDELERMQGEFDDFKQNFMTPAKDGGPNTRVRVPSEGDELDNFMKNFMNFKETTHSL